MMTRIKFLMVFFLMIHAMVNLLAQDILMTIGDNKISLEEFERIYKKNNKVNTATLQTPEEYLDLFINFKLKVIEAESLGMDTTHKFLKEFNKYKEQLAKPYLENKEIKQTFMKDAYERMKWDQHISHILLKIPEPQAPNDTALIYSKALKIRKRLLEGEDFETVARATSDDPSVKVNGGDLGFFNIFTWPLPDEIAAYKLKIGEISMPLRTIYGYDIVKKLEQRPSAGQVKVAHIFIRSPKGSSEEEMAKAEHLAKAIYDSLAMGIGFDKLAFRYSDDRASATKGGELPWFETGRMLREFETQAFALKNIGDYCKPFQSSYGWHLIKLLDKKGVGSYEEMESEIQQKIIGRNIEPELQFKYLEYYKKKYHYKLNSDIYNTLYTIVDSTIFKRAWDPYKNTKNFNDTLFTFDGGGATLGEFCEYLANNQNVIKFRNSIVKYVNSKFNESLLLIFKNLEKETLPERYPEYKYILQEYHDGILLFDLMDQMVWTKAVKDTSGLENFFNNHRSDYRWGKRTEAIIVNCDSTVDVNSVKKKAAKIGSGKWSEVKLNSKFCNDSVKCITLENIKVESGKNDHVDALKGNPGVGNVYKEEGLNKFVIVTSILPEMNKELNETRGQVTSDYQEYLEKQWIKELRDKYEVKVNKELLSKIE